MCEVAFELVMVRIAFFCIITILLTQALEAQLTFNDKEILGLTVLTQVIFFVYE